MIEEQEWYPPMPHEQFKINISRQRITAENFLEDLAVSMVAVSLQSTHKEFTLKGDPGVLTVKDKDQYNQIVGNLDMWKNKAVSQYIEVLKSIATPPVL